MTYPEKITVYEVGPRDGLQNETGHVSTEAKVRYIELLAEAGFPFIEATSFVSPRAIPQLADAPEVMARLARRPGVRYPVLVPNEKGMMRALEAGVTDIALFTAASESFTRANINCSIQESLANFGPVISLAQSHGIPVRGYVSTALGCPYEGPVSEDSVLRVASSLLDMGVWQVSIGDTIGVGTPRDVERVFSVLLKHVPAEKLAAHFHDTRGTALANTLAVIGMGVSTVDSASGGLGGCPYAPGASGNLATEDLLYMLHGLGIETGVDLEKTVEATRYIMGELGRAAPSKYVQASLASRTNATA